MTYQIETLSYGAWTTEGLGTDNTFETEAEAEETLNSLLTEVWPDDDPQEFRIVEVEDEIAVEQEAAKGTEMQVHEAIVKAQGNGGYALGGHAIHPNSEISSVDDWFDAQASMAYVVRNVTADWSGIVGLGDILITDRGVTYASLVTYPGDEPTVYALWEA